MSLSFLCVSVWIINSVSVSHFCECVCVDELNVCVTLISVCVCVDELIQCVSLISVSVCVVELTVCVSLSFHVRVSV